MAYLMRVMWRGSRLAASVAAGQRRYRSTAPASLVFSEEVVRARDQRHPIVALESTIITHGMPYPQNLETALEVENIIRERGAVPATVAILKGQLTIGLTEKQLRYLAEAKGVVKASRRDLAPVAAARLDGATTVAGTLIATELADIPVFVTGGIGGVHREGEQTLDVSADLNELGRSRTLVVCSGVKSILDIGRTLEYLETQGVCVCAFGDSDEFPAFYTARSGHRAPHRVGSALEAARVLHASRSLDLRSGIVIGVPVPHEHAMNETEIEDAITLALEDANKKRIYGKEVTPFILAAVAKVTGGASLAANIALIKNNAKVGADIAVEFSKLENSRNLGTTFNIMSKGSGKGSLGSHRGFHTSCRMSFASDNRKQNDFPVTNSNKNLDGDVLVIGGSNVDRTYRMIEENVQLDGSTHACAAEQCAGGVGRNMAEALWQMRGGRARLLTAVGDDSGGRDLTDIAPGLILDGCVIKGARTPTYAAMLDAQGECLLGLGDMDLHDHISTELVDKHMGVLEQSPLVVLDGNVPQRTIAYVLKLCHQLGKPVFFEPTDRRKAVKALHGKHHISFASPNLAELQSMAHFLSPNLAKGVNQEIPEILANAQIVSQKVEFLVITLGAKGVITVRRLENENSYDNNLEIRLYSVITINLIENVSGAGDCFSSGFVHGLLSGLAEANCVSIGFEAAKHALQSRYTVPNNLNTINIKTGAQYVKLN